MKDSSGEPSRDIIFRENSVDKNLEHDWIVVISRFLAERHRLKDIQMTRMLNSRKQTAETKKVRINYSCEKVNQDLSFEENSEILANAENFAFQSVSDEVKTLAVCGHQKALAFYLQHVPQEEQSGILRFSAEKIAKKESKIAEEWEIAASLNFIAPPSVDDLFGIDAATIRDLIDQKSVAWDISYSYATAEIEDKYAQHMAKFVNLSDRLLSSLSFENFVKANAAYYGRNVISSFKSISELDDCLFFIRETNGNFFDKKMIKNNFRNELHEDPKAKGKKENEMISYSFLRKKLKERLKVGNDDKILSENGKIKVKGIPTYMKKKVKDLMNSDENLSEKLAHARYLALYQNDQWLEEWGFTELSALGSRAFKSEVMKVYNTVPQFLENFRDAVLSEETKKKPLGKGRFEI